MPIRPAHAGVGTVAEELELLSVPRLHAAERERTSRRRAVARSSFGERPHPAPADRAATGACWHRQSPPAARRRSAASPRSTPQASDATITNWRAVGCLLANASRWRCRIRPGRERDVAESPLRGRAVAGTPVSATTRRRRAGFTTGPASTETIAEAPKRRSMSAQSTGRPCRRVSRSARPGCRPIPSSGATALDGDPHVGRRAGSGSVARPLRVEISASTRIPAGSPTRTSPEIERTAMSLPAQQPTRTSPLVETTVMSPSHRSRRRSPDVSVASRPPPTRRMVQSPETDETFASPSTSPHERSPDAVLRSTRAASPTSMSTGCGVHPHNAK